jgi:hypothetical protein
LSWWVSVIGGASGGRLQHAVPLPLGSSQSRSAASVPMAAKSNKPRPEPRGPSWHDAQPSAKNAARPRSASAASGGDGFAGGRSE